ncbi:cytochrome P450 [Agrocybe pediades]|nr:cytochrome P450 [Agrocybe pediades]
MSVEALIQTGTTLFLKFNPKLALVVLGFVVAYLYVTDNRFTTARNGLPMPPGPPQSFLKVPIGWKSRAKAGAKDAPTYKKFAALNKIYGPIISFYQGRTPVVVLGTIKAATALLDKKGNIYSSRPRNIMAGELLSGNMRGLGMPYGQRWRNYRLVMHAGMNIEASNGYKALQSLESKILLKDLFLERDPAKYAAHLRRFAISIVCFVGYGMRVESLDDPIVVSQQAADEFSVPGQYIVESWPILLKLPKFMQWFRREPLAQRARDTELYMGLMESVRARLSRGEAPPSVATRALEKQATFGLTDLETAYALSAPFAAGVGSTLAVLDVFFLAMLHYPEVMKKAQAEIDSVVGQGRLPEFEDADSLPYVKAIVKETLRWKPIAPHGVPHSVIADDVYEDKFFIPRGSTVIANVYSMSKDEEAFPSANEFKPERYLNDNGPSSSSSSSSSMFFFGFGRRICPGMHIAQNSLFIVIVRILWAYNVVLQKDAGGNPVPMPDVDDLVGGLVVRPRNVPFYLEDRRRGTSVAGLVLEEGRKAEEEVKSFMM